MTPATRRISRLMLKEPRFYESEAERYLRQHKKALSRIGLILLMTSVLLMIMGILSL